MTISDERIRQLESFAAELRNSPSALISAAEMSDLIAVYRVAVKAPEAFRIAASGAGPARGTLEHRIEELEGTVAELTKIIDESEPVPAGAIGPNVRYYSSRNCVCGVHESSHLGPLRRCPR